MTGSVRFDEMERKFREMWPAETLQFGANPTSEGKALKKQWLSRWCSERFGPTDENNANILTHVEKLHPYNTRAQKYQPAIRASSRKERLLTGYDVPKRHRRNSDLDFDYKNSNNKRIRKQHHDKEKYRPRKRMKHHVAVPKVVGEQPVETCVKEALSTTGVSPESIVRLINNMEDRDDVIKKTGFSNNYLMKLQRKVLHSSQSLQLRSPDQIEIGGVCLHVLFDSNNTALFINKELCELLSIKGTTFSYWKKKSNVEEIDTSSDFRLMDQCRSIFGGRSTYNLITAESLIKILNNMQTSRQKNASFESLQEIARQVSRYINDNGDNNNNKVEVLPTITPEIAREP